MVLRNADSGMERVAASSAAPEDDGSRTPKLAIESACVLDPETDDWAPRGWFQLDTALTITPLHGTDLVLVVGRVGGPDFLASEVTQIGDLGCIVGAMLS